VPNVSEDGVAKALRKIEVHGTTEAPTKISQALPDLGPARARMAAAEAKTTVGGEVLAGSMPSPAPPPPPPPPPPQPVQSSASPAPSKGPNDSAAYSKFTFPEPPGPAPDAVALPAAPGSFTLSDLWPEAEREGVRQAEAMIAAKDAVNAILACDVLVTRVLASAAGLVGTLDAPRDPAVVSLMLGLDGARYMNFRVLVRAARHRENVTMRDAVESYSFALEARRARELLRR
jgi:hypothetical protein